MKPLSWTSIAIMIGLPALLGFVAWLIWILSDPAKWCGVPVGAAKTTGQRLPIADCTSIVLQLIHWLGWYGVTLIGCICIAFLTLVTRDVRAFLDVRGPNGWGAKVGGDDAPATVTTTTTTAVATPSSSAAEGSA
jgi:hypothetical protein